MNPAAVPDRRTSLFALAILICAAAVYLSALGRAPLRINAERRCAEVVERMVATKVYAVPYLGGEIRVNKPPVFYHAAVLASWAEGAYSLASLRLPSALGALGILLLVLAWARELGMPRGQALLALALLAATYSLAVHARRGSYEALFSFACNASLLSLATLARRPSRARAWLAVALAAFAIQVKGTPYLAVVVLPVVAWLALAGRGRVLGSGRVLAMSAVAVVAGAAWYIWLLAFHPATRRMVLGIFLLPFGVDTGETGARHFAGPQFYLIDIWTFAFPMSLLLPVAAWHVWRERLFPKDSPWRLVGLAFVAPFLLFSLLPQKQDHYLLPCMLPLALLCARGAAAAAAGLRGRARRWLTVPAWIVPLALLLVAPVLGLGLVVVNDWPVVPAGLCAAAVAAAGLAAVAALIRNRLARVAAPAFAGLMLVWWAYMTQFNPVADAFGSASIYQTAAYDEARWNTKFARYPFLRILLDVDRGLDDLYDEWTDQAWREAFYESVYGTLPPGTK